MKRVEPFLDDFFASYARTALDLDRTNAESARAVHKIEAEAPVPLWLLLFYFFVLIIFGFSFLIVSFFWSFT